MTKGFLTFVLHSHLPWLLGHGRWPHGIDWLNEAVVECYLPLIEQCEDLVKQGLKPHITVGITPILQEQLNAEQFKDEFDYYLDHKIKTAKADIDEFKKTGRSEYCHIARMWHAFYSQAQEIFSHNRNILTRFKELQNEGAIEIMTSAATHGYLPLLKHDRSVSAQIQLGVQVYKRNFSQRPRGIWLPECAYRPAYAWKPPIGTAAKYTDRKGIDEFLGQNYIDYFIIDTHMLKGGKALGTYLARFKALQQLWKHFQGATDKVDEDFVKTPQELYLVASNPHMEPVAVLTRDPRTALQVWSGELGYPGDARYLDFHKKRFPGGLRYWRVTDPEIDLALKQIYDPVKVDNVIMDHARHFVSLVRETACSYYDSQHKPACICVPFDTELFGHWWFEGPRWLGQVIRLIDQDPEIELTTGSMLLESLSPEKLISLPEGSWGEGGFHYIWLNKFTEWTWNRLYEVEDVFFKIYDDHRGTEDPVISLILKQLAREMLLLQSSDWQFLISTWSARDYAELRFSRHYENFTQLVTFLEKIDNGTDLSGKSKQLLQDIIDQDNCFKDLDLSIFSP